MKELGKRIARVLCGDYGIYYVYRATLAMQPATPADVEPMQAVDAAAIVAATDVLISAQAGYAGEGSRAFALREQGVLQAVCFYWFGERYRPRGFWPLQAGEAKLVQIVTAPAVRGRGLATALIAGSAAAMHAAGWSTLYARVWHSNQPSWHAFEAAGWERVALVVEINPLRRARPWRIRLAA